MTRWWTNPAMELEQMIEIPDERPTVELPAVQGLPASPYHTEIGQTTTSDDEEGSW